MADRSGVVFHMMNALEQLGLVGLTAVGNGDDEPDTLYAKAVVALNGAASKGT